MSSLFGFIIVDFDVNKEIFVIFLVMITINGNEKIVTAVIIVT